MMKLCHHLPNLKAISSISTNPVVLHYRLRISDTTTSTPILPVNIPNTSHRATRKVLPIAPLHNDNNKLLAPFFAHIPTKMEQRKTETNHRDLRRTIRAHSDLQQILNDQLRTIPTNVDHHLLRRDRPTKPNETIDHRSDHHRPQISAHPQMDQRTTNRATLPTPPPLSAITVDASVTMQETAHPHDPQPIVHPTNDLPIMKTLLLAITNAPISLPTLVKTLKILQDTITKLSKLPPLTNLMITLPTSHGPILTYHR